MEKKGFKWQMCVGSVFMLLIIMSLFLPAMNISGEKYLKTAVQINKYAKDKDSKTASEAQVDKNVIDKYKKNTSKWDDKVKEFDDEIEKKDKGDSISQLILIKWLLTADEEIDDIEGIEKAPIEEDKNKKESKKTDTNSTIKVSAKKKKSTKKKTTTVKKSNSKKTTVKKSTSKDINKKQSSKKLKDSDVKDIFKFMAVLLLLPVILSAATIILIIATGKTNQIMMILTGAVTLFGKIIYMFFIPGMVWDKIEDYVKSLTLVDAKILAIDGVGKYAVSKIIRNCTSISMYIVLVASILLLLSGILFMTILKPEQENKLEDSEWDFGRDVMLGDDNIVGGFVQSNVNIANNNGTFGEKFNVNASEASVAIDYVGNFTTSGERNGINNGENICISQPKINTKGYLYGMEGEYSSSEIQIDSGEEIIFGRDPACSTLVFSCPKVSRKHCGVKYDASIGGYLVIDYSSNGIEFSDGTRPVKGQYVNVSPGTVLYLAGRHEAIKLGEVSR